MTSASLRLRSTAGGVLPKLIGLMLVLTALVVLAWMLLLPKLAQNAMQGGSEFTTRLDRLAGNPFTGSFQGGNLHVRNPTRFGGDIFAEVANFDGVVQVRSVTRSELVVERLTLDITKLVLVVDASGKSNLDAFGASFAINSPATEDGPVYAVAGLPVIGEGPSQVMIRRLDLTLGRLEVLDLAGAQPMQVGDNLNFTHSYENVRSVEQLLTPDLLGRLLKSPQLWQALVSSGAVPGLDRGDNPVHNLMEQGKDLLNSLFRKLEQTGKP